MDAAKQWLQTGLLMVAILMMVATACWFGAPGFTSSAMLWANARSAGLTHKTIQTDQGELHYLEGGTGPTIVFLHGIYARKDHWVDMARYLTDDYHVIALDLPGFGDNKPLIEGGYRLDVQAQRLPPILDRLQIEKAHFAANSMGAQLVARLYRDHPERFHTLAFIGSPLGVPTTELSDMQVEMKDGAKPLLVRSHEDFAVRNAWLFVDEPYVPGPVLKTFADQEVAQAVTNERIWDEVTHNNNADILSLLDLAPSMKLPVLVLWCADDRIFHPSGAPQLTSALPDATLHTPKGCGHVPMLDIPHPSAMAYRGFLGNR